MPARLNRELTEIEDIARIGHWRWDVPTATLSWSAELYRLAGRDPKAPPPTFSEHLTLLTPASVQDGCHPILNLIETGASVEFETAMTRASGDVTWVFNRCVADRGPDGRASAVRGIVQDVTERKATDLVRDRLASIVDAASDGIIATDLDGTITAWNRGAEAIYGYTAAEVIGHQVDLLATPERKLEPMSLVQRVIAGEPEVRIDTVRARKDGQLIECSVCVTPIRDARGQIIGVSAIVRDFTEHNQTARKLLEQNSQFKALFDQGVAGIYILSETGVVRYVNAGFARVCGYSPDDVIGHPFIEFVVEADRPLVLGNFADTLAGHLSQIEAHIVTNAGPPKSVLAHSTLAQHDGQPAVIGVLVDITAHERSERALQRSNGLLRMITEGNEVLVHSRSESELMQRMCAVIVGTGHYHTASIALQDGNGDIEVTAAAGDHPEELRHRDAIRSPRGPDGRPVNALHRGEPLIAGACAYLPLRRDAIVFGTLGICATDDASFEGEDLALLTELADDLSYGIFSLRARVEQEAFADRLQRSMEATIEALAATAEMRDPYTAGHQRHVAELAVAIAQEIGLEDARVHALHLAAIVHDIGKIKIPTELLTKPTPLTSVEGQLLQTHVEAGYDILKSIDFPWPIAEIVRQHHERLDGSGYPHGLRGEHLHLEAKILAVADVVDAMAAHRPYRFGLGLETTLATVEAGRGTLYESSVVDACLRVFRRGFGFSQPPLI